MILVKVQNDKIYVIFHIYIYNGLMLMIEQFSQVSAANLKTIIFVAMKYRLGRIF